MNGSICFRAYLLPGWLGKACESAGCRLRSAPCPCRHDKEGRECASSWRQGCETTRHWRSIGPVADVRWRSLSTGRDASTTALMEFVSSDRFGNSWPTGDIALELDL